MSRFRLLQSAATLMLAAAVFTAPTISSVDAGTNCPSGNTCIQKDINYAGGTFAASSGHDGNLTDNSCGSCKNGDWNDDASSWSDSTISTSFTAAWYFDDAGCSVLLVTVPRGSQTTVSGSSDSRNDKTSSFTLLRTDGTLGAC